ncbi:transposase [Candidatus Parcubacteria bacterium]|nr:transposase [Candidatus Parcubacteria bacterium]
MRKTPLVNGQYYHIYNRGTEKRPIFLDNSDLDRFFEGMIAFNSVKPIGSIFEYSLPKNKNTAGLGNSIPKLANIIAYSLNPNHFHLILEQISDQGIQKFMHRLSLGYTNFFNLKYKRSGALFQGRYKAKHINFNSYLLHLSAYINLNNKIHYYRKGVFYKSGWSEYVKLSKDNSICTSDIILQQFKNIEDYIDFAYYSVQNTIELRQDEALQGLFLE